MIEHWTTVEFMAKVKTEKQEFTKAPVKRINLIPSYYTWLHSFGRFLIKLGTNLEQRFKIPNYHYDVVGIDA